MKAKLPLKSYRYAYTEISIIVLVLSLVLLILLIIFIILPSTFNVSMIYNLPLSLSHISLHSTLRGDSNYIYDIQLAALRSRISDKFESLV